MVKKLERAPVNGKGFSVILGLANERNERDICIAGSNTASQRKVLLKFSAKYITSESGPVWRVRGNLAAGELATKQAACSTTN